MDWQEGLTDLRAVGSDDGWWVADYSEPFTDLDLLNIAASSISTISTVAAFTVTALGFLVALFALIGWAGLSRAARAKAQAEFLRYINSARFDRMLEQKVAQRIAETARTSTATEDEAGGDDPFPRKKEDRK